MVSVPLTEGQPVSMAYEILLMCCNLLLSPATLYNAINEQVHEYYSDIDKAVQHYTTDPLELNQRLFKD